MYIVYTTTLLKVGGNTKEKRLYRREYNVNTLANIVHSSFIKLGVLDKYKYTSQKNILLLSKIIGFSKKDIMYFFVK